jgi:formate-dependent nitrite reductase membrane component NrfD
MLEITTTRHNPLIDPRLHVWSWEIPVYLFLGGLVAGMMVLAGYQMLKVARGETRETYAVQAPILAFVLINLGMGALFLDLAHKLYVWRVYLTFEPTSPMSWGSWVLIFVYGVVAASALIRLDEAWPWLGRKVPQVGVLSRHLLARPGWLRLIAALNIGFGVALGIYTGILLSTMVARPLWNSALLGPLFLVSGLSAACALMHLLTVAVPMRRPAPAGMLGGAFSALLQPLTAEPPPQASAVSLVRFDQIFLATELALIVLLLIGLVSTTAAHQNAATLLLSGPYAWPFWGLVVALGIVVPFALQALELRHRIPHTVAPALLVLVGGFALRWILVDAGQASSFLQLIGMGQ